MYTNTCIFSKTAPITLCFVRKDKAKCQYNDRKYENYFVVF